ncbi:MAG: hypothetical protein V9E81_03230 [Marmoricola sp.]
MRATTACVVGVADVLALDEGLDVVETEHPATAVLASSPAMASAASERC